MRLILKLRDVIRTLAGIRTERALPPTSDKPLVGTNIVRNRLRIRLKYPISDDLWNWLSAMGWRSVDMRNNRRRYTTVPDKVLVKFIKADTMERHVLHDRLIKAFKNERHFHTDSSRVTRLKSPSTRPHW